MTHFLTAHGRDRLTKLIARRVPLTCTIAPPNTRGADGVVTVPAKVTSPCRYSEQNERVKQDDGTYAILTTQVFEVPATTKIEQGYTVRIGTGDLFAVTSVATPTLDGMILRKACVLKGARG